jgi:hypothetical protein
MTRNVRSSGTIGKQHHQLHLLNLIIARDFLEKPIRPRRLLYNNNNNNNNNTSSSFREPDNIPSPNSINTGSTMSTSENSTKHPTSTSAVAISTSMVGRKRKAKIHIFEPSSDSGEADSGEDKKRLLT